MNETKDTTDCRHLSPGEIDSVSGGYGGYTKGGTWVTCGSIVIVDGTIYVGGINGPVPVGSPFR